MIPYGRQDVSDDDIANVVRVLKSDFLTQGNEVPAFENRIAKYCSAAGAVAFNSATSALHAACIALGVSKGDIVWTSAISFVASANCALYCGATVDFVDVDPMTHNMSVHKLEQMLSYARSTGTLPKVVIPVHLSGLPCDMEAIYRLSKIYNFKIIEDASHAIGSKYQNKQVGSCTYSDITIFSFHPVKIITTGEGGMALTNSPEYLQTLHLARSHGVTRDASLMTHEPDGPWYYQQISLGYNYRMTDISAALGNGQMNRLDSFVVKRNILAERYDKMLATSPLSLPWRHSSYYSSFHLYIVRLNMTVINKTKKQIFKELADLGVGIALHYIPIPSQPYYRSLGFIPENYPAALSYYSDAITLPIFPSLSFDEQDKVVACLLNTIL